MWQSKGHLSGHKRVWSSDEADGDFLPAKLLHKQRRLCELHTPLSSTTAPQTIRQAYTNEPGSDSSSSRAASPAPLSDLDLNSNRLAAYDADTSPPLKLVAPSRQSLVDAVEDRSSSLPPSSPVLRTTARLAKTTTAAGESATTTASGSVLTLKLGQALLFGRKAKQGTPARTGDATPVLMPKSARNASRQHALVRFVSIDGDENEARVEVDVTGMNGIKIDGTRWRAETKATVTLAYGQQVDLDFWGWNARIVADLPAPTTSSDAQTPAREQENEDALSSGLSSPFDGGVASDDEQEVVRDLTEQADTRQADELVRKLNLDLAGLVASAITFHPQSTVDAIQITRSILRETGGMWEILEDDESGNSEAREQRAVELWRPTVEALLTNEPFFGCIPNTGLLDASGNPVPAQYFYVPDKDPSMARVEALEPFVKRVRGARTAGGGKQYFWKRPSLKKNR